MTNEAQEPTAHETPEEHPNERELALRAVQRVLGLLKSGDSGPALVLFDELHPADQGEVLTELEREGRATLLETLAPREVARVLEHLETMAAVAVSEEIEASVLGTVLDELRPDVAADILRHLPVEQSRLALEAMNETEEVAQVLGYGDETAGGLMTPQYPVVKDDMTTAFALDVLRLLGPKAEAFSSVFVVDGGEGLVGTLSIPRLAMARPSILVQDVMDPEVVSVLAGTDQEECARLMERYDLRHLPVVDEEHRLIGTIQLADVVDVVVEEATEDMYRMVGMAGERLLGPVSESIRHRLPWLYINLATTFLAASVIALFESTIARVAALAVFLPVIAGQGGIGGTQTLTLVVRSMALGELTGHRGRRLLVRETLLGIIHGLLLSVGLGVVAYLWKGTYVLGLVVAAAMLGNMMVAGLAGVAVPLALRRLKMDPAVSSAVFITTFTDLVGFILFLGLATALISYLV